MNSALAKKAAATRPGTMRLKVQLVLLIASLVVTSGLAALYLVYRELDTQLIGNKQRELASDTEIQATHIQSHIRELVRDVQFLSNTPPVQEIVNPSSAAAVEGAFTQLATIFTKMLAFKPQYVQVRFIGIADSGREILRADRYGPDGSTQLVPSDRLQHKGQRGYFIETMKLGAGQVYLSEIELNREYGKIAIPHEPVLRAAVPVFTRGGKPFGIVIINEHIQMLFTELDEAASPDHDYIIINDKGDYLKHPDNNKAFAFEFGRRGNAFDEYPSLKTLFDKTDPKITRNSIAAPHLGGALAAIAFAYNPLDSRQKIGIIALSNREQIEKVSNQVLTHAIWLVTAMMLLAIMTGLGFLKNISRPFSQILQAIRKTNIELTLAELPVRDPGPAGMLAQALQHNLEEIRAKTEQLSQEIRNRISAEQDLQHTNKALSSANRELEQFTYIASHDLKAPLRVIVNIASWLIDDLGPKLEGQNLENLAMLQQRARRMERMLDDLFEYLRIGHSQYDAQDEKVTARIMLDEIIDLLQPSEKFQIMLQGDLDTISVHKMPLQHVLINLIGNAIKHQDVAAPKITITAREVGDDYLFSVEDSGLGIDPAYHQKIFDVFTTLKPRDELEGSGIGLAIAKKITDTYGGSIELDSPPGRGCTFTVRWPKNRNPG